MSLSAPPPFKKVSATASRVATLVNTVSASFRRCISNRPVAQTGKSALRDSWCQRCQRRRDQKENLQNKISLLAFKLFGTNSPPPCHT